MLGNFIADNISRKEEDLIPAGVAHGIKLHREIDRYTDDHPSFKTATALLRPSHGKYAPVVLDILMDHLLALSWESFFEIKKEDFFEFVYHSFDVLIHDLPPRVSLHVKALLEYKYLAAYETKEGLTEVLVRMDKRTSFPSDFKSATHHLYADVDIFKEHFFVLFKDLVAFVDLKMVDLYPSK